MSKFVSKQFSIHSGYQTSNSSFTPSTNEVGISTKGVPWIHLRNVRTIPAIKCGWCICSSDWDRQHLSPDIGKLNTNGEPWQKKERSNCWSSPTAGRVFVPGNFLSHRSVQQPFLTAGRSSSWEGDVNSHRRCSASSSRLIVSYRICVSVFMFDEYLQELYEIQSEPCVVHFSNECSSVRGLWFFLAFPVKKQFFLLEVLSISLCWSVLHNS
jgi:hypothetical protein